MMKNNIKRYIFASVAATSILATYLIFAVLDTDAAHTKNLTNFEKGQHYFNQEELSADQYDIEKAELYYKAATGDMPLNPEAWYQLGRTHFIQSEFDEAITALETQLDLFGTDVPSVYYMLGLSYGYRARDRSTNFDWQQAERYFEIYVNEIKPDTVFGRVDLAWIYFSQGKFLEIGPLIEAGLMTDTDNPWLLNMYGLYQLNGANDPAEALFFFKLAKQEAAKVTIEEWGSIYPGNNPRVWEAGLQEFNDTINKNIAIAEKAAFTN